MTHPDDEAEKVCLYCGKPFSSENVFTKEGWAEIKISGVCEKCFDDVTDERNFE